MMPFETPDGATIIVSTKIQGLIYEKKAQVICGYGLFSLPFIFFFLKEKGEIKPKQASVKTARSQLTVLKEKDSIFQKA